MGIGVVFWNLELHLAETNRPDKNKNLSHVRNMQYGKETRE